MRLEEYYNKRNFAKTPEPQGKTKKLLNDSRRKLKFVVQRHDATRLHYDFRLETEDGVLKSWAVPKGLSQDPKVKRLAVLTEDHPLDYLNFEGVIPEGNYGAGTVMVWDTGNYTTDDSELTLNEQFRRGKIAFSLFGKKLAGKYFLIRTARENQWLLIKGDDDFVSDEDLTFSKPKSVLTGVTNEDLQGNTRERIESKGGNPKLQDTANQTIAYDDTTNKSACNNKESDLIRMKDLEFSSKIKPMLAKQVDKPFDSKEWVFEIKWDGVRSILFLNRNKEKPLLELKSRSGKVITHRYPEIIEVLKLNNVISCKESIILDGEIVVLNKGYPDFQSLQRRMNLEYDKEIQILSHQIPVTYYLFDILYLDGQNLQNLSFLERRRILSKVVQSNSDIKISDFFDQYGISLYDKIKSMALEGIIAKKKSSAYLQGQRSHDWLKIKNVRTQDCIVIGYTRGEGNRQNYFGSLILAAYDNTIHRQRFIGHTGSGFNFDQLDKIYRKLNGMAIDNCPIRYVPYTNRNPVWIRPELVAEVKYSDWTDEKIMRAPIFLRFREDKKPEECTIEDEMHVEEIVTNGQSRKTSKQGTITETVISDSNGNQKNDTSSFHLPSISFNQFSNLDKPFWSRTLEHPKLTKGNLIEYYDKISSYILPHIKNRPLSLSRYPDGIAGKHFYHKNWDKESPQYVETVKVYSNSRGDAINYVVCNNRDTLLWLANLGCIEMHPWYSRVNDYNACSKGMNQESGPILDEEKCGLVFPDFIVFDLDPYIYSEFGHNKETLSAVAEPEYNIKDFKAVVDIALYLKDLLDQLKIKSYVKTSGKTGLHIYVPIQPLTYEYSQTRSFAEIIGKRLINTYPEKITMQWDTGQRKGKVFFDYNQNSKGKTIASVFSARPTTSATVSMPIRWDKLNDIFPTDFTILNVPEIINRSTHTDTWGDILNEKQDIIKILEDAS